MENTVRHMQTECQRQCQCDKRPLHRQSHGTIAQCAGASREPLQEPASSGLRAQPFEKKNIARLSKRWSTSDMGTRHRDGREPSCDAPLFSFSACGWLKIYHFGVAKALQEGRLVSEAKFVGSSAGSLIGLALALGLDFERIRDFQLGCVDRTHGSLVGAFRLRQYVEEIMDNMLPADAFTTIGDRVEVSFSSMPSFANRRVNIFRDNSHLRQAILASCCMAPLAGMPFRLDGELVYDGAISDWLQNQSFLTCPEGHAATAAAAVRVTPFWFSRADIRPSQYIPLWWALYPPRRQDFEWVFELGYRDGSDWVRRHAAVFGQRKGTHCASSSATSSPDDSSDGDDGFGAMGVPGSVTRKRRSQPWVRDKGKEQGGSGEGEKWRIAGKPSGAFTRAFGYRSILYMVPSWLLDAAILLWLVLLVKPAMAACVYGELLWRVLLHREPEARRVSWSCATDGRLALRCIPFFGFWVGLIDVAAGTLGMQSAMVSLARVVMDVPIEALYQQSLGFRVCMHFLLAF